MKNFFRIVRMRESGIYDKWEGSYLNRWDDDEDDDDFDEIVGFKIAYLEHFFGLFLICVGMTSLSFVTVLLETMLVKNNIKQNQENNTEINLNKPSSHTNLNSLYSQAQTMAQRRQSTQRRMLSHSMSQNVD